MKKTILGIVVGIILTLAGLYIYRLSAMVNTHEKILMQIIQGARQQSKLPQPAPIPQEKK